MQDLSAAKKAIADRVKSLMETKGLNPNQIGKSTGKDVSNLRRLLKGEQNITLESIVELENILGGSIIEILPPEPEPPGD